MTVKGRFGTEKRVINPPKFWQSVFGCVMDSQVIKILCVLLGTDYNKYRRGSVIHLKCFSEILTWLNLKNYSEMTLEMLKNYVYVKIQKYPADMNIKETVVALNLYLNNIEGDLQPIDIVDEQFNLVFK
jgi:hypothetical protein